MISECHIKNQLAYVRSYCRKNISKLCVSQWVDIGDGDEFQIRVEFIENVITGNVCVASSLRFHGSGAPVHPGTNCGKIDLDNLPSGVVSRHRKYASNANFSRYLKRHGFLSSSKDTFITSNNV